MKTVELPDGHRAEMDWYLEEFERWSQRMVDLEATILSRGKGVDAVERLRTIPGTGYYSAMSLACIRPEPCVDVASS